MVYTDDKDAAALCPLPSDAGSARWYWEWERAGRPVYDHPEVKATPLYVHGPLAINQGGSGLSQTVKVILVYLELRGLQTCLQDVLF